jgi:hypothetical protein
VQRARRREARETGARLFGAVIDLFDRETNCAVAPTTRRAQVVTPG